MPYVLFEWINSDLAKKELNTFKTFTDAYVMWL